MNRTLSSVLLVLIALGVGLPATAASEKTPAAPAKAAPAGKPGDVLATVNGTKVTRAEFEQALKALQRGGRQPGQAFPPEVRAQLLDQMVKQELLSQEASRFPVKDLDRAVDTQIQALRGRFPNAEAFQKELAADGLTEAKLKTMARRQLTIQNYVATQIAPKIKVTDAEAKTFYDANKDKMKAPEQVKASHVLISVPPAAKPEDKKAALAKATAIQKRAAKGEDFAKLARENSQDPGSAQGGGDLGYFTKDRMVEPFAKAAFALKPGQVSEVVETPFGFHVIKLTDRKAAKEMTFAEEKEKILNYLKNKAAAEAVAKRVEELRKAGKVTVSVPNP